MAFGDDGTMCKLGVVMLHNLRLQTERCNEFKAAQITFSLYPDLDFLDALPLLRIMAFNLINGAQVSLPIEDNNPKRQLVRLLAKESKFNL